VELIVVVVVVVIVVVVIAAAAIKVPPSSHTPLPSSSPSSSALNQVSNEKVAIKKIPRAFDDVIDAKRILREVKLLRQFDHENVSVMGAHNLYHDDYYLRFMG